MSTTGTPTSTSTDLASSTSVSSAAASSASASTNSSGSPGTFYKNLFYILIGLLCAFGLISFLSLMRARHRRNQIVKEAARLGVLVPGVPGYVPMRARQMTWARADGSEDPDWWEVEGKTRLPEEAREAEVQPVRNVSHLPDDEELFPLAVIPPPVQVNVQEPVPQSILPFFPNHLAYRASSLLPPPARFVADQPETMDELSGENVDIVTIIRMPGQTWPTDREVEESQEVVREWGGVELGISRMEVIGPKAGR